MTANITCMTQEINEDTRTFSYLKDLKCISSSWYKYSHIILLLMDVLDTLGVQN